MSRCVSLDNCSYVGETDRNNDFIVTVIRRQQLGSKVAGVGLCPRLPLCVLTDGIKCLSADRKWKSLKTGCVFQGLESA